MIYLDNAATTRMVPEAVEAMQPYFSELYGNPGSPSRFAEKSRTAVRMARDIIAESLHAKPEEIFFTSGGSESDNWAIKAAAEAYADKGKHIITTKIEHHAVLHTCGWLEKQGYEVSYIDVEENGIVNLQKLCDAIRDDTILISVMYANNEIGTIQPVREIGEIAKKRGILFHTDAVQAYAQLPIDVTADGVDMLSASGHKFGGPKGCGFLYIRKGVKIRSFMHGGQQERSRRAGTENVPGIVGMGAAAKYAFENMQERGNRVAALRDYFIGRILKEIPDTWLNGDAIKRLPGNANFSFRAMDGETMLIMLDQRDICASSGSACTSGSLDPSHVLLAIGLSEGDARSALRFSLSGETTREELDEVVAYLKEIVTRNRKI